MPAKRLYICGMHLMYWTRIMDYSNSIVLNQSLLQQLLTVVVISDLTTEVFRCFIMIFTKYL